MREKEPPQAEPDIPSADRLVRAFQEERRTRPAIIGCVVVEVNASGLVRTLDDDDPPGQPGQKFLPVIGGRAVVGAKGINIRVGESRPNLPEQRVVALLAETSLIGEIISWPVAAAPAGFMPCDGAEVSRTTYAALFAIIGTLYGPGDGSTTFNLPDYRGRVGVCKAASGTFSTIGDTGGSETAALPTHSHDLFVAGGGTVHNTVSSAGNQASQTLSDAVADSGAGSEPIPIMNPYIVEQKIIRVM